MVKILFIYCGEPPATPRVEGAELEVKCNAASLLINIK